MSTVSGDGGGDDKMEVDSATQPGTFSSEATAPVTENASARKAETPTQMDVDEDDEVVQECDIYLNRMYDPPDFVGDLYVMQYPLRPIYRKYGDQGQLDRVDLKPKARRLRFVYKFNQNDNYDDDGSIAGEKAQQHVLNSVVVTNPSCSYAIGVIQNGRMTLTPIRAINQLRPDFEHVDRQAARAARGATSSTAAPGAAAGDESDNSGAEENMLHDAGAAPLRVEYTTGGGKADAGGAEEGEEPWSRLDYFDKDSAEARDIYVKHIVWPAVAAGEAEDEGEEPDHPKLQGLALDGDREMLLGSMCGQCVPRRERKDLEKDKEDSDGLSAYMLSRLPPERQVEYVVRHYGIASYSRHVRKRLPPSTMRTHGSDDTLLALLRKCAVLVAGNWVLKSELAGFDGSEAYARDMLLCLFDKKHGRLSAQEMSKWGQGFPNTSQQAREEMTRQIAERDKEADCVKLKVPADQDFKKKYPHVVKEFSEWWDRKRGEIITKMQSMRGAKGGAGASPANALASSAARQRAILAAEAKSALASTAMTTAELRRYLQKRNQRQVIKEHEVQQALAESPNDVTQVRNLWLLGTTGNEGNDKFRSVLQSLFKLRDCVSKSDILKEYEQIHGHKCKLSDYVIRTLLREISDRADGENYFLKGQLNSDPDAHNEMMM